MGITGDGVFECPCTFKRVLGRVYDMEEWPESDFHSIVYICDID